MRTRFLIIGATGPLGSGCSKLSEILSTKLSTWVDITKKEILPQIDTLIGEYYKHIRTVQDRDDEIHKQLKEEKSELLITPSKLSEIASCSNKGIMINQKELNRKLRELLQARDTLAISCRANLPKFTHISMSDMIVKIAVSKSISNGQISPELSNLQWFPDRAKSLIAQFAIENLSKINTYDNILSLKKYSELTLDFCSHVDSLMLAIRQLKDELNLTDSMPEHWLQEFGDNLRATGNPFVSPDTRRFEAKHIDIVALEANRYIKYMRRRIDNNSSNHFVIDTFRNPAEVSYFRKRYASFYLISVYANQNARHGRKKFSEERDERDQGKDNKTKELYKQNVSACVLSSDYAITNELGEEQLWIKIARLLSLIELPGSTTPTYEETFMNMAYNLSVRSNCLSRQVGAVITNKDGFVIGAGWNDVGSGQLGCARRRVSDLKKYAVSGTLLSVWEKQFLKFTEESLLEEFDARDCFCFKDIQSRLETVKKIDKLWDKFLREQATIDKDSKKAMETLKNYLRSELNIKRLEYARALHAEENAILQVATHGGMGVCGGTIFTTTFPCELCAKKIYQSGITRIVYTEPYPDSLSESIFLRDGIRQIECDQFEGVKANSYFKLFKPPVDHKEFRIIEDILDS